MMQTHKIQPAETLKELALFGGEKAVPQTFKRYNSIGQEELQAATAVLQSGNLSQFIGAWHEDFYGGPQVLAFEKAWCRYFRTRHAVTVNSATSGLIAALGAIGVEPGDEVIVSPWTMCASATAILHWNAIPVFADIEAETFCLDPVSVEKNITPYTKAIVAVDIFGHSANMDALRTIANKHGLKLISDTAQAPGALYKNHFAGTCADVGIFSLNYHKHIHTGEGGVIVTNDDEIAERLKLIRNHAEAVVVKNGYHVLNNMIGYNFRLGEIESAIGIEQLKKLPHLIESRRHIAHQLNAGLQHLAGLRMPHVDADCTHVYYIYPMVLDVHTLGVSRSSIYQALSAEGVAGLIQGYQNIHLLPVYQQKIAYGQHGFPWSSDICQRDVSYHKGICPVAESLHDQSFLGFSICAFDLHSSDVSAVIDAFHKVWAQMDKLPRL